MQEKELVADKDIVGGICTDYIQNLQLSTIPVQETFYLSQRKEDFLFTTVQETFHLRQLTVIVFCIHNVKGNNVVFFMYHEGVAGKSPNEVCSFILQYVQNHLEGIEHLHIFLDPCERKNKKP